MNRLLASFLKVNNLAFIVGILMSINLWLTERNFPVLQLFEELPIAGQTLAWLFVFIFIFLLAFSAIRKSTFWITACLLFSVFMLLQDYLRWQPWTYLYSLFLIPLAFKKVGNQVKIQFIQIILIGVYLWSGIHKLNQGFLDFIFVDFALDFFHLYLEKYKYLGLAIPVLEIGIGLGFCFNKTRKFSFYLSTLLHLGIICWPLLGSNTNYIILPWNLAMIAFNYLVFFKTENFQLNFNWKQILQPLSLFGLLVMLLPSLYYFNAWPHYLSFTLYSGNAKGFYIAMDEEDFLNGPYIEKMCTNIREFSHKEVINPAKWAIYELNVPTTPENFTFSRLSSYFCNEENSESIEFMIYKDVKPKNLQQKFSCKALEQN